jgi:hypothetical protein
MAPVHDGKGTWARSAEVQSFKMVSCFRSVVALVKDTKPNGQHGILRERRQGGSLCLEFFIPPSLYTFFTTNLNAFLLADWLVLTLHWTKIYSKNRCAEANA